MGLFDKKFCDICGEKIGLLGNRKLEDGNCCKDCARKLSPFFSERRHSTVEDIKNQLAYREENSRRLADLHPTLTFGNLTKLYLDPASRKFIVTRASDWRNANPDIVDLSQITNVEMNEREHKTEIYKETTDGKRVSFNPPRYDYAYEFDVKIAVDSPWFDEITFELSEGDRPDDKRLDPYREYVRMSEDLRKALTARETTVAPTAPAAPAGTSSVLTEKFGSPVPITYRYVDPDNSIDVDFSVKLDGEFSYEIVDPSVYATVAADPEKNALRSFFFSALNVTMMSIELPRVPPDELHLHSSEILAAIRAKIGDAWGPTCGVSLLSVTLKSAELDEANSTMLKQLRVVAAARQCMPADSPFNAPGAPETVPSAPAAPSGKWKCPSCTAENEGKFCEYCGAPRP